MTVPPQRVRVKWSTVTSSLTPPDASPVMDEAGNHARPGRPGYSHLTFAAGFSADKCTHSLTCPCSRSLLLSHAHTKTVTWLYPQGDILCLEVCCTTNHNLSRLWKQNDCTLLYLNITSTMSVCVCVLVILILPHGGAKAWLIVPPPPARFLVVLLLTLLTPSQPAALDTSIICDVSEAHWHHSPWSDQNARDFFFFLLHRLRGERQNERNQRGVEGEEGERCRQNEKEWKKGDEEKREWNRGRPRGVNGGWGLAVGRESD